MRLIDADALIMSLDKRHEHWHEIVSSENKEIEYAHQYAVNVIRNAPSAEPTGDLISREDAIKAIAVAVLDDKDEIEAIKALPSAEAVSREEYEELYHKAEEVNDMANDILSDFPSYKKALSAEAVQGWILCSERLPDDIRPVLVTWKNNDPASYYQYIVGKHFIGTAYYHRGKWYWYSSVTEDLLAEYGKCDSEEFDEAIEAVAWMPLPNPWKGADDDN